MGPERTLSQREIDRAEELGGADLADYTSIDTVPYCDKGEHRATSEFHSAQHREHWQKIKREQDNTK